MGRHHGRVPKRIGEAASRHPHKVKTTSASLVSATKWFYNKRMPYKDPEKRKEYHRAYMRQRYANDAEHRRKHLARVRTKYAEKAKICERCGAEKPEAHHPDYMQPDLRIWLCRCCHLDLHNGT